MSIPLRTKLVEAERKIKALQSEKKGLEKEIGRLDNRVASIRTRRKAKPLKLYKTKRGKARGDEIRVCVPDTHGSSVDRSAASVALSDIKTLQPHTIILLGDHVDCGGWLDENHTLGYVSQTDYSWEEDIDSANQFLNDLADRSPKSRTHYIEGNHEYRVERDCVKWTKQHRRDAEAMRRREAPEFRLQLAERGIQYYRQCIRYGDVRIPGTLKLSKCFYTHGWCTSVNAARKMAQDVGGNVVYAHTHRADYASYTTVAHGEIGAWNAGCLSIKQPFWKHSNPSHWTHGYAVQVVSPGGNFLHINVPIINRTSMLVPLLNQKA